MDLGVQSTPQQVKIDQTQITKVSAIPLPISFPSLEKTN